ncbi:MAG: hypothetical protein GX267_19395 [Fibrobacter sp.]|jgi:hypothetical protein|nr:hypothetical protein [Fibrobacter sp.]
MKVRRYLKSLIILPIVAILYQCSPAPMLQDFESGSFSEGRPYSKADGLQINAGTIYTLYNTKKMNMEFTLGTMYRAFCGRKHQNTPDVKFQHGLADRSFDVSSFTVTSTTPGGEVFPM